MQPIVKTICIWLITAALGTALLVLYFTSDSSLRGGDVSILSLWAAGIALVLSVPGMLVYHFIAVRFYKLSLPLWQIKLSLAVIALLLVVISAIVTEAAIERDRLTWQATLITSPYALAFIMCSLLFTYYQPGTTPGKQLPNTSPIVFRQLLTAITAIILIGFAISVFTYTNFYFIQAKKYKMDLHFLPLVLNAIRIILIPLAVYLLWKQKRSGWIILTIFSTSAQVATIAQFPRIFSLHTRQVVPAIFWIGAILSLATFVMLQLNAFASHYKISVIQRMASYAGGIALYLLYIYQPF